VTGRNGMHKFATNLYAGSNTNGMQALYTFYH
jgi:hypothetical protein